MTRRVAAAAVAARLILTVLALAALTACRDGGTASDAGAPTPLSEDGVRRIVREEVNRALAVREATAAAACDVGVAAARVLPSVLQVETRRPGTAVVVEQGSGFVALAGGIVLTAAHVVAPDAEIELRTPDGRRIVAELLRVDRALDLAVLRAADRRLPPVRWADTGAVALGESLRIVGFPYGRPDVTVTGGVLAARTPAGTNRREELRTDADVDAGNSGGPLVTSCGEALGVVVQRQPASAVGTIAVGAGTALPFVLAAAGASIATPSPSVTRVP